MLRRTLPRFARTSLTVGWMCVVLSACAHTDELPKVPLPEVPLAEVTFRNVGVDELVGYMVQADVVADATLVAFRREPGTDGMEGTMEFTVVECYRGPCAAGTTFRTRYGAGFFVRGPFCAARQGCTVPGDLHEQVGALFFATFSRGPYIAQTAGSGFVPELDTMSLNRGYYLIHDGELLHNDPHYRVDARHADAVSGVQ